MSSSFVSSATGRLSSVLLCPPTYLSLEPIDKISQDWLAKGDMIDRERAAKEHQALVDIYQHNDVNVELMTPSYELHAQVFSRDFGFNLKEGYVLGQFMESVRQPEHALYTQKLEELNVPMIAECKEGIIEGGDFWQLDESTLAIGVLQRSNEVGIASLKKQLEPLGYNIISVQAKSEYLHLDMMFNIVAEKTAVVYYEGLPEHFKRYLEQKKYTLIKVSEADIFKHFCNLQALGGDRVISLRHNIAVNAQLRALGLDVFELDATEILKAGGGPHCMSFPLKRS